MSGRTAPAEPLAVAAPRASRRGVIRVIRVSSVGITWAIAAAFLAVQVAIVMRAGNGPFLDESIYVTAGRRTIQGFGISDYYLTWFAGSLLWPVLAATADSLGGLAGARILAALCVTAAILTTAHAAGILLGARSRPWTAGVMAASGCFLSVGHLAVYDALALAAAGVGVLAVAQLHRYDRRRWALVAGGALAVATLAKYPVLPFAAPPVLGLVAGLRGRRALFDLLLMLFALTAALVLFFLPEREQLARFLEFRTGQNPGFGVTRPLVLYALAYFSAAGVLLGLAGWFVARGRRLSLAPLLTGWVMPAVFHLGTNTNVGVEKHAAFAVLFAAPLAGYGLARAWEDEARRPLLLIGMAGLTAFGLAQVQRNDRGWLDVRPSADYLVRHVRPGDLILADNAWPYAARLYAAGKIATPFAVHDAYRVLHGQDTVPLCAYDWWISSPGGEPFPAAIRRRLRRCGTFRRAYVERGVKRVGLTRDLRFVTFPSNIVIRANARPRRRP